MTLVNHNFFGWCGPRRDGGPRSGIEEEMGLILVCSGIMG